MMAPPLIRPAQTSDAGALVPLMQQLGYGADAAGLVRRIAQFATRDCDHVLVAEAEGAVVGCISLHWLDCFHVDSRLGRVTALVVDERCRGKGVGAVLVAAGEAWLRAQGCTRVELTTNAERTAAHRFYRAQGYSNDSLRFVKPLSAPTHTGHDHAAQASQA